MTPGGPSAIVVLDFGKEVGGTPYVAVSASTPTAPTTSNTLRVSTSEALTFLNTNKTTTLSSTTSVGDTNVKVGSVAPFYVGSPITIDTGTGSETRTVTAVGTAGTAGTGITFSPGLTSAHAAGTTVTGIGTYANDNGSQINFSITTPQTYTGGLRGGFRFASIALTTPGTVTLTAAGVNFKAYRASPDKYQGYFISSDDQLNKIWYAGAYTAQMDMVPTGVASCFNVPVIFDGAKRDRAIWSGDLMITNPVAMLSIGSNSVPYIKGSIDSIINLQAANGRLTSAVGFRGCGAFDYAVTYSAYSAIIATQYYRYTGDTAYITALLPKLEAATAYHATRLDANGLVVTNDNDYWQTRQNGEVTEYSLAYYELLQDMIWLEHQVGTPQKAAEYTEKAAALKEAINSRLWNASAGLYQHTDTRPNVFPLDANMNAIRLGVAPTDKVQSILTYFKDRWQAHGSEISQPSPSMADPGGHTIEPLNNTWEMMARFHSDDAAGALDLLRRMWGVQVDPNSGFYTGTFWEFVNSEGLPTRGFDSLAHAWGAGPTQLLTESVLGATSVDPGYATWQVKPQPSDLGWAQGQVPTASGPLTVKWAQNTGAGKFHMEVVSPAGTGGEVWVPLASATSVSVPLTPGATFVQRAGNYDVYRVGAGTFQFSSQPVTFQSLQQLVTYFSTDPNVTEGLNDKLQAAAAAKSAVVRGNQLNAFANQVKAQTGKALTPDKAQILLMLATALR
ncbi:alpha-L-rhamnosidase C-terminal domain-containing protein [Planotetraspora thailandica]|uniref:alpha-L-rhamnosidase-related protein n=1 Tax=Planotetraspora thailandica TaxID=487172 RepID=UPI00194FE56F|nr:alpha-L-rhamnosidase C-terminal domain-containing protein [Planotetraspora thailandica]